MSDGQQTLSNADEVAEQTPQAREISDEQLDNFASSGGKTPNFATPTDATIASIKLMDTGQKGRTKPKKNSPDGDEYHRYYVQIQLDLATPVEDVKSVNCNLSLMVFPGAEGKMSIYWGETSDSAKFRTLVSETFGVPKDAPFSAYKAAVVGKRVKIRSEMRGMPGTEPKPKPLIKQFVG